MTGLGGLTCNTVCVPVLLLDVSARIAVPADKQDRAEYGTALRAFLNSRASAAPHALCDEQFNNLPVADELEYLSILHDTLRLELNLIVAANFSQACVML